MRDWLITWIPADVRPDRAKSSDHRHIPFICPDRPPVSVIYDIGLRGRVIAITLRPADIVAIELASAAEFRRRMDGLEFYETGVHF